MFGLIRLNILLQELLGFILFDGFIVHGGIEPLESGLPVRSFRPGSKCLLQPAVRARILAERLLPGKIQQTVIDLPFLKRLSAGAAKAAARSEFPISHYIFSPTKTTNYANYPPPGPLFSPRLHGLPRIFVCRFRIERGYTWKLVIGIEYWIFVLTSPCLDPF